LWLHSRVDGLAHTAAARAASPGALSYWELKIDPDGKLDPLERARRAEKARRAHFTNLALKSSQSRARKRAG
jgi:hypothetical protein